MEAPSSPAALLLELFPDMPLDIESLVATLGPEEATRVCFELMASDDGDAPPSDAIAGGDEESVPEQLAVLQGYFPDSSLEALFEALSMGGSLDGAIATLMEAQSAAEAEAELAAAQAATAPPSGKEKEKVAQLRHAYPVIGGVLLYSLLNSGFDSHRRAGG